MFFVSSILISHEAFYTVARFFEGGWLFLAEPRPWLVSVVVGVVLTVFMLHAWLALRKFPANFRQYRRFPSTRPCAPRRHRLWWIQLWTGFALFFLGTVHLYGMLTQPELIGPYESADRIWTGSMWPLYLLLLFAVEIHGGVGLYRLALKWGWLEGAIRVRRRRRLRIAKTLFQRVLSGAGPGQPAGLRATGHCPCGQGRRALRAAPGGRGEAW
jgi:fumarate reductase subunit C